MQSKLVYTNGETTLSRMNLSGYAGHVTIFSSMFTIACCLAVGLGLGVGLGDLVSGWLVAIQTLIVLVAVITVTLPQRSRIQWRQTTTL